MSHKEFIALKQRVIESAIAQGCKFLASSILHDVAKSPDEARRNEINRICYHFNCFLSPIHSHGLVLIDRFSDVQIDSHLREKFSTGLTGMPYGNKLKLQNIVGFHYSAIGQSHFGSLIDIVLGSFRFAINAFTRNDESKLPTSAHMLQLLQPLFVSKANGHISEVSLFFSPKIIRSAKRRAQYVELKKYLSDHCLIAEQSITEERTY